MSIPLFSATICFLACQSDQASKTVDKPITNGPTSSTTAPKEMPEPTFIQEGVLEFRSSGSAKSLLRVEIEIAHEEQERNQGLMWRKKMAENQAMLFVFEASEPQSFWMRNTYIPLDIIFVNERFEVVSLQKNVPILNDTPRPSGKPAKYVIEVNAGVADKYKIAPGTIVAWSDFVYNKAEGPFAAGDFN